MGLVGTAALLWGVQPGQAPALWAAGGILSLALAPLLAGPLRAAGGPGLPLRLLAAWAVALLYFGLHGFSRQWLGVEAVAVPPALVAWVLACFGLLFVLQGAVRAWPRGALARGLYPWLFAGLYLDELFTRLTFRLWPARLPPGQAQPPSRPAVEPAPHNTGVR